MEGEKGGRDGPMERRKRGASLCKVAEREQDGLEDLGVMCPREYDQHGLHTLRRKIYNLLPVPIPALAGRGQVEK